MRLQGHARGLEVFHLGPRKPELARDALTLGRDVGLDPVQDERGR
jgi:hypothetical protein